MNASFLKQISLLTACAILYPAFARPAPEESVSGSVPAGYVPAREKTVMSADQKREAAERASEIVGKILRPEMTEFEKILLLHEYMTSTMTYAKWNGTETSAYTALVHQQSDCVGFARGLGLLLEKAGIENRVIARKKGHLWNQVTLRGKCYYIDATWSNLKSGWNQYSWFLLSEEQNASPYHKLDSGESYPECPDPFVLAPGDYTHRAWLRSPTVLRLLGRISLPPGEKAPSSGILFHVNGNRVIIPAGQSSAAFVVSVPRGEPAKATLRYSAAVPNQYAKTGYYSANGTVLHERLASVFDASKDDVTDIDLRVVRSSLFVSGVVRLPQPAKESMGVTVQFDGYRGSDRVIYSDRVHFEPGESRALFRIDVSPEDRDRRFRLYTWSSAAQAQGYEKSTKYPGEIQFAEPELRDRDIELTPRKAP